MNPSRGREGTGGFTRMSDPRLDSVSIALRVRASRKLCELTLIYSKNRGVDMARLLQGSVAINGVDDESWPFSDERVSIVRQVHGVFLDTSQPAVQLDIPDVRWGGECRVEVRVTARVVDNDSVQIEGNVKLFEGDSENTQDLEEERGVVFLVGRSTRSNNFAAAHHSVRLSNRGIGGGDYADVSFSFTNAIAEE